MRHLLLMLALAAPVAADPLELYRWFHTHPELSKKETQTSQRLAQELKSLGLEVEQGIGGNGIMALLRGQPGGPVVLYRADMDALPVQEATGLTYASQVPGVMHACGHDLHMACAVAALGELAKKRDQWKGTIVFVGQPAEELGDGAKIMISDPRFQQILKKAGGQPKMALALHDNATLPVGQVSLTPGYVNANVDSVDIIVHGLGGHGAHPDTTVDPIVMASEIVLSLQTIVSRRLEPGAQALVTVGKFVAGSKHNIIPPKAELALTVRSYDEKTRQKLLSEIRWISQNIAAAYQATGGDPRRGRLHPLALQRSGLGNSTASALRQEVGGAESDRSGRQHGRRRFLGIFPPPQDTGRDVQPGRGRSGPGSERRSPARAALGQVCSTGR